MVWFDRHESQSRQQMIELQIAICQLPKLTTLNNKKIDEIKCICFHMFIIQTTSIATLKRICQFDEFFTAGYTRNCHFDNFRFSHGTVTFSEILRWFSASGWPTNYPCRRIIVNQLWECQGMKRTSLRRENPLLITLVWWWWQERCLLQMPWRQ